MQFDLIVKWMKTFDLKTGQAWRAVWRRGKEPQDRRPLGLAPNRKLQSRLRTEGEQQVHLDAFIVLFRDIDDLITSLVEQIAATDMF
jgi:hypothetical protein